jgi:RNA polymerase-binding transcription factor DksA
VTSGKIQMAKRQVKASNSPTGKTAKPKAAGKKRAAASKPAKRKSPVKGKIAAKKKPSKSGTGIAAKKKTAAKKKPATKKKAAPEKKPTAKKSITHTTRTPRRRAEPQYEVEPQVRNVKITKRQVETIQRNLLAERDRLVGEMARLQKSEYDQMTSGQSHRFANHQADVASDMSILDTMLIQSGIEADRLRQVQDALERLEAGHLGICDRCGANVGYERMLAKPFARYCIVCRAHLEKQQRTSRIF